MLDFNFYAPTNVFFGKGKEKDVGEIIKGYGFSKIMIQYGKGSVKKSGLLDVVFASLKENGIDFIEMGGVEPNPKLSFVKAAVELAKCEKVELILAVGGGSVLDSCKATAIGFYDDGDIWDFFMGKRTPTKALPVGCILTIAAAGSEMSNSAVITNEQENIKKGLGSKLNRCLFSICNPELTYSVNTYQTACGIVDIMAHTMERYFTVCDPTPLTDGLAEALLRSVIDAGKVAMENPNDYNARATLMWASSLSHNGLTDCGRERFLAVHQLEHALSGEYDFVAHGAGLAMLFPAWAKYVYLAAIPRFAQFARKVWGVTEADDKAAAEQGIKEMYNFFASLKMPMSFREFGINEKCAEKLALSCTFNNTRTITSPITLGVKELTEIFESCY